MDGMRAIRAGFERDCHSLLNAMAAAVSGEVRERSGLVLPPPSGKTESGDEIKVTVAYVGPASDDARTAADEVLRRAGNPAEMVAMLERVGLR